ncbi:hypothetical protein BAUCODRAFT_77486 [Baudoinia panamericana UAMH 10762]|uniref:4a-hydroxytetrahydrobiopterin dehydratase n=1 Tax=Baudoinia panamericana (strain UAMH 10762) TaxID=717646 RepID=M2MMZ8_BAUPA|nr:uncharacterized protein BAUCODRAFT_77486 [Baudoinia panamericana UAMH 10762]EMC92823.1 hypothetical protein BAUCODRAFT_77486 [Baudoinia panamericana UAMH 10762]
MLQVTREAQRLLENGWKACSHGQAVERHFTFKTFAKTWAFMDEVAAECKKQRHHPEWRNVYNKTHIRWTTHRPNGLSLKDTLMARFCDEAAKRHGELPLHDQPSQKPSTTDTRVSGVNGENGP